jgi:hypothetical protein
MSASARRRARRHGDTQRLARFGAPHIFSQIHWQGDPTIASASSPQIVIIGLLILVVQRIFRLRLVG